MQELLIFSFTLTDFDLMHILFISMNLDVRCDSTMEQYLKHIKVFKALSDPKRAMIVDMLSCGELCACKILERFDMSQSTLSHHMKLLRECGLVNGRNEGKWTHYSLNNETVTQTREFFCNLTSDKGDCICKEEGSNKGCGRNE